MTLNQSFRDKYKRGDLRAVEQCSRLTETDDIGDDITVITAIKLLLHLLYCRLCGPTRNTGRQTGSIVQVLIKISHHMSELAVTFII